MAPAKIPQELVGSPEDTEQQFYEALQLGDIERLMAVWSDDDEIVCVHPGGPRLIGLGAIRAVFEAMFANGTVNVFREKVQRLQMQAAAVHSVLERVQVMTQEGPKPVWVIATNVYVKTAQGWRLVTHHASPGTQNEMRDVVESAAVLH